MFLILLNSTKVNVLSFLYQKEVDDDGIFHII